MDTLKKELLELLKEKGAALVGVANMNGVENCDYPVGISVALPIPKHTVEDLKTAPTKDYYDLYHSLNSKLNGIVEEGEAFLREKGYHAFANTTEVVKADANSCTPLPHKTVATRAGLGWIGKSCILVTPEYGGAIRISTLLTNAPLPADEAITESRCGGCCKCVEACPAQALTGTNWKAGMAREELADIAACEKTIRARMQELYGFEFTICGKCFAICPYTQRYLNGQ